MTCFFCKIFVFLLECAQHGSTHAHAGNQPKKLWNHFAAMFSPTPAFTDITTYNYHFDFNVQRIYSGGRYSCYAEIWNSNLEFTGLLQNNIFFSLRNSVVGRWTNVVTCDAKILWINHSFIYTKKKCVCVSHKEGKNHIQMIYHMICIMNLQNWNNNNPS